MSNRSKLKPHKGPVGRLFIPLSRRSRPSSIQDSKSKIENFAEGGNSYSQILRSSSIIGGASGISYIIGMVRTKVVAVLLGPSGVGLVGLYVSITGLFSTIAQLGIAQSGVREVAEANGSGDSERVARMVKTLRRACWFTGILGWILTAVLAWPVSQWTFGSPERMWAVVVLGATVFLGAVTGGQTALLQGMRRIGDLARIQVLSAIVTTLVAVGLYAWLGEKGIIPVIIFTSVIQLGFSWLFSRRIQLAHVPQSWAESARQSKQLIRLGAAFVTSGLIGAIVGLGLRALIVRYHGLEGAGLYQAAWGLSGMFGGFIITAMGTDYYPRLTAVISNHEQASALLNQQTEIGVLLALPGLLATLALSPYFITIFYSGNFAPSSALLNWYVGAVFCRMITFPMGFVLIAKGLGGRFTLITTAFHLTNYGVCAYLLPRYPLYSIAIANFVLAVVYIFGMRAVVGPLLSFRWSIQAKKLLGICWILVVAGLIANLMLPIQFALGIGLFLFAVSCLVSLRGMVARLSHSHRIIHAIVKIPGFARLLGLPTVNDH